MNGDRVDAMDSGQQQRCMECEIAAAALKIYVGLCFHDGDGCKLTTPDPSALILSVKFCNQETGTHLHTQERNKRFSMLQLLIAISPFCHVLFGAIFLSCSVWHHNYHYQTWYSCACTPFLDDVWRSKRGPNGLKKHGLTHPHRPPS
jgi:hypothetical protein